jgi:hypothetical protein
MIMVIASSDRGLRHSGILGPPPPLETEEDEDKNVAHTHALSLPTVFVGALNAVDRFLQRCQVDDRKALRQIFLASSKLPGLSWTRDRVIILDEKPLGGFEVQRA